MTNKNHEDESDEGRNVQAPDDGLPIDRGWAWVVLAASWTNIFLVNSVFRTFGIMFIDIEEKYGASASQISSISALSSIGFGLSTMLVQTIGLKFFSTRQTVMLGSFGMGVSYVISAFSPVVELLMVFQGFVAGVSTALMFAPTSCLIGQYFEKKRGLAMCVASSGGGVGTLVYSFSLRILLDTFGLSGTLLLLGGFGFHGLVSGALQRPFGFYKTKNNSNKTLNNQNGVTLPVENGKDDLNKSLVLNDTDNCINSQIREKQMSPLLLRTIASKRIRTYSETSKGSFTVSANKGGFWQYASNELSTSIMDLQINSNERAEEESHKFSINDLQSVETIKGFLKGLHTLHLLKKPVFILFLCIGVILTPAFSVSAIYLPVHAQDIGLTAKQGSFLITVSSIIDVLTIPLWGAVSDRQWLRSMHMAAIASTAIWIATFFLPYYNTFEWLIFYATIYGLFGRVWFSMGTLIIVDLLGLENLQSALGIQLLCQTAANAAAMVLVGSMRDAFGSYLPSYFLMAILLVAGTLGLLLLPVLERCDKTRHRKTQEINV